MTALRDSPEASSPERCAGSKILVVDDSAVARKVLSKLLTQEGYRVRTAAGGVQGLRSARRFGPDLVLLDVLMPDMDGFEVCRRLKEQRSTQSVPVLFISGLDAAEDKVRAFEAGGEDYVTKPFQASEVLARVRTHLARRQADTALRDANLRLESQLSEIQALQGELRRQAATLLRTAARLNAWVEPGMAAQVVCEEIANSVGVAVGAVLLYSEDGDEYRPAALHGLPDGQLAEMRPVPRSAYEDVASGSSYLVLQDARTLSNGLVSDLFGDHDVRTVVAAVMNRGREPVGLLIAGSVGERRDFSEDDLALLRGLADQAAQALANARLFEEVRSGREVLRSLSERLMEAQETERREVARELHDEIGQTLTGLKLSLAACRQGLPESAASRLVEAREMVEELMGQVRDLSLSLRPSMLDDLGLMAALLWSFGRYTARTGVRVDFKHQGVEGRRFDPRLETAAYRILQEALTNVARHAGVAEAQVRLWADEENLGLLVEDRGAGFSVDRATAVGATGGLAGMRERARLLGGELVIESTPANGTRLVAELPLGRPEKRERT